MEFSKLQFQENSFTKLMPVLGFIKISSWIRFIVHRFPKFWEKICLFCIEINGKRKSFLKHRSPPYYRTPLLQKVYITKTYLLPKWGSVVRGGTIPQRRKTEKGRVGSFSWISVLGHNKREVSFLPLVKSSIYSL